MSGRVCPSPGCGRQVPFGRYACPVDWKRLPAGMKTTILRAWGRRIEGAPGASQEHEDAKAAADAWLTANPR